MENAARSSPFESSRDMVCEIAETLFRGTRPLVASTANEADIAGLSVEGQALPRALAPRARGPGPVDDLARVRGQTSHLDVPLRLMRRLTHQHRKSPSIRF